MVKAEIQAGRLLDPKTADFDDCCDDFLDFVSDHFDSTAYLEDKALDEGVNVDDDDEFEEWFDTDHAANMSTDAGDLLISKIVNQLS